MSALYSRSLLCVCPLECLVITGLTTDPHTVAKAAAVLIYQTSTTSDLSQISSRMFLSAKHQVQHHSDYECTRPGEALGNIASHLFGELCLSDLEQVEPTSLLLCPGSE